MKCKFFFPFFFFLILLGAVKLTGKKKSCTVLNWVPCFVGVSHVIEMQFIFLQYIVILEKKIWFYLREWSHDMLSVRHEKSLGLERKKERWVIPERKETVRGGTSYTVASMSCPCTLQRWIFPLWHCSFCRHQSQTPLVLTL